MFPLTIRRVIGSNYLDFTWDEPKPEEDYCAPTQEFTHDEAEDSNEEDDMEEEEYSTDDSEPEDSRAVLRRSRKKSRA